jgi:hypothetical protein
MTGIILTNQKKKTKKKQEKEIRVEVVWEKKSPHNNQKFEKF